MRLSVVIPTRGRAERLAVTLTALSRQHPPDDGFEVIIAVDGDDEETLSLVEGRRLAFPVPLVALSQERRGPGHARNTGMAAAHGHLILFLGDDTRPLRDDLILRHADLHTGASPAYAVLGSVVPVGVTPLERWLERSGTQFALSSLEPGFVAPSRYFYCAHVSLSREFLLAAGGFDSRFPFAAVEDIELGLRLGDRGLQLDYHPEVVVVHDHVPTLQSSIRRAERVGQSAALFAALHRHRLHPDLRPVTGWRRNAIVAAAPLGRLVEGAPMPVSLRERLWRLLHLAAYVKGYEMGPPSA